MATKISDLPAATTPVGAQFCIIQDGATKRLPTTALVGAAPATPGTVPLYDASGRLIVNGIQGYDVDAHVTVDLIARGLQSRDDRSGYPGTRLLFEASGVEDETIFDVVIPAAKAGIVAMTRDIPTYASQAEAEAGTATTKMMSPLRVAEAIAALAGSGVTEATSGEAKAGAGSTQLMTPRRVAEARRVVERVAITGGVANGSAFALGVNVGITDRVLVRLAWTAIEALAGAVPPHFWRLKLGAWTGASYSYDGTSEVDVETLSSLPAEWAGLAYGWPAGKQLIVEFADASGSGSYMSITTAEIEFEWRDA